MDFEQLIEVTVDRAIEKALTPERVENIAFSKFDNKSVTVQTAADLLGVSTETIRNYVKYGHLKADQRKTDKSPFVLQLSEVLKFKKK